MGEALAGGTVKSYTVIGNVDANGKAQPLSTTPLSVASGTATTAAAPATAAVTSTSAQAVAANTSRVGINIENVGSVDASFGLGANAAADNSGIVIKANGGTWDGLISGRLWTGAVNAKTPSGSTTLAIQEIT